jgi:ADP-ribosylglycohydrolase
MNLTNKIKSGIFGVAVGDALGVPVEFVSRTQLQNYPVKNMREFGTHRQPAGTWSDDSSLTFCLMESLCKGFDPEDMGVKFLQWKNEGYWTAHGSVFDIGLATRQAIMEFSKGTKPELSGGFDEYSNGNGSLMRILPMAFFLLNETSIEERFQKVKIASSLTHAHIRSVIACFIYVEYAMKLIKEQDRFDAYKVMQQEVSSFLKAMEINPAEIALFSRVLTGNIYELQEHIIRSSGYVLHSLEASIWAFLSSDSFESAVLQAVNLGEDTDTNGAITGGLAGIHFGFNNQFDFWRVQLARFEDIDQLCEKLAKSLSHENNSH